jgi:hypothetical protein
MWSWSVSGLFMTIGKRMTLRIPLPVVAVPLRMYVEHGELVVVFRDSAEQSCKAFH